MNQVHALLSNILFACYCLQSKSAGDIPVRADGSVVTVANQPVSVH